LVAELASIRKESREKESVLFQERQAREQLSQQVDMLQQQLERYKEECRRYTVPACMLLRLLLPLLLLLQHQMSMLCLSCVLVMLIPTMFSYHLPPCPYGRILAVRQVLVLVRAEYRC
jgi:hypothetical protein